MTSENLLRIKPTLLWMFSCLFLTGTIFAGPVDSAVAAGRSWKGIPYRLGLRRATGEAPARQLMFSGFGVVAADNQTGTPDPTINWIQASEFDQNGNLVVDSRDYYDNDGALIQSQVKNFYRANPTTVYTHVLASAVIKDAYGRTAVKTLPAPIDYADFSYRANFLQHNASGAIYNHQNFDVYTNGSTNTNKTNTPDPLWDATTGSPGIGTLAWYYNTLNTWEPYTATTSYPYIRATTYQDGTAAPKKMAAASEPLIMGTGHETSNYTTPVADELDFYIQVRNKYFPSTQVGNGPSSLIGQAVQTISHDQNGLETVTITDQASHVLVMERPGTGLTVNNTATVFSPGSGQGTVYYFKLLASGAVGIAGGTFTLYDMNAEQVLSFTSGGTLPAGYYKVINTGGTNLTLTYSNSYMDIAYNFYDQKGQMVASISPEGVKRLYGSPGIASYATLSVVPFVNQFTYDARGRMLTSQSPDMGPGGSNGITHFVYSNDGRLRFSQSPLEAGNGAYSYANYDGIGRVVETGEYVPDANGITFSNVSTIVENTSPGGGLTTGVKVDVSTTQYDLADYSYYTYTNNSVLGTYVQEPFNLARGISVTRKYNSIVNNNPSNNNLISATWFNYDEEGKVVWLIQYVSGLGNGVTDANSYKTTNYTYDMRNNVTKKVFQAGVAAETFVHYYNFDPNSKNLYQVFTNTVDNPATEKLQATYYYYLQGRLKRIEVATNLQGIDYTYTLHGNIKSINNNNNGSTAQDPGGDGTANGFSPDAFGEVLDYYTGDYTNARTGIANVAGVNSSAISAFNTGGSGDSYAGSVKAMSWFTQKNPSWSLSAAPTAYIYQYDPKYQLVGSTFGTGLTFGSGLATYSTTTNNQETVGNTSTGVVPYDGNGNIQYLTRTNASGAVTDKFSYQYGSTNNQLTSVTNVVTSQTYATYGYDYNGQLVGEVRPASTPMYITYDAPGKVTNVYLDVAHTQPIVTIAYGENGERVKKVDYNTSTHQPILVTYYVNDVIYTQPVTNGTYGAVAPAEYEISGVSRIGIYYPQTPLYAYELQDHQGSVRAVVTVNANTLQMRAYSDYYPFGMPLVGGQAGTQDRYGYQGQYAEADGETNWNAFVQRMYDSRIGRWLEYDPQGQFYSPYVGMGNSPVSGVDKDGAFWDELYNLMTYGMFISTPALQRWGHDAYLPGDQMQEQYEWVGNKLTGHGLLTETSGERRSDGLYYSTQDRVTFQAQRDFFQKIGNQVFAVYPDFEASVTFGAQVKLNLFELLDLEVNFGSVNLAKYDFIEGASSVFTDKDKRITTNFGMGVAEINMGVSAEWGPKGVKFEGGGGVGVTMTAAKELMNKEAGAVLGISKSFSAALVVGVEAKFGVYAQAIPNNDIDAFMKRGE